MTMDKVEKTDTAEKTVTLEKTDTSDTLTNKSDTGSLKTKAKRLARLEKQDSGSIKSEKIDRSDKQDNAKGDKKTDKAEKADKNEKAENGAVNGLTNGEAGSEDGEALEVKEDLLDEEKERLMKVLVGELEDLPPLGSKIVRILTSSTFTGKKNVLLTGNIVNLAFFYCLKCTTSSVDTALFYNGEGRSVDTEQINDIDTMTGQQSILIWPISYNFLSFYSVVNF